jgi:putative transposase
MRKKYPAAFKAKVALEAIKELKTIGEIASENSVHPTMVRKWRDEAVSHLTSLFDKGSQDAKIRKEQDELVQSLYGQIGELSAQLSWLKKKSGDLV